ncbi:hypothetical protein GE061_014552 [Apolygus lucorum]|uniref:Uncharacterized protein n=1 Tax=Apolygus lucorum TaxID=248454 RepID=A0A6A4JNE4_APOLU|nr:hypothetical protein GE061_014552 [Apolygus lucorum]
MSLPTAFSRRVLSTTSSQQTPAAMSRILLVLLSAVLAVNSQSGNATVPSEPNASCTAAGLMCKNCNQISACIQNPNGRMTQLDIQTCPGSCRDGQCVKDEVCNWRPFTCSIGQNGVFPDPYDCTIFQICDGTSTAPTTKTCPIDSNTGRPSAYGSETGDCGYPIAGNSNCVNGPVPRCQNNLEVNSLPTDPTIFYICTLDGSSLAPMLFKCPPTTSFNSTSFVCS